MVPAIRYLRCLVGSALGGPALRLPPLRCKGPELAPMAKEVAQPILSSVPPSRVTTTTTTTTTITTTTTTTTSTTTTTTTTSDKRAQITEGIFTQQSRDSYKFRLAHALVLRAARAQQ